jgi:probable HAF family extracellular repeat protein
MEIDGSPFEGGNNMRLSFGLAVLFAVGSTAQAGDCVTVDHPDPTVTNTQLYGINSSGQAVGYYVDAQNAIHGFLYDSITMQFTRIDYPEAIFTSCGNISENGDIVGRAITADHVSHGYLLRAGVFTLFDAPDPGTTGTVTFGINPIDDSIVGDYCLSGDCLGAVTNHGFILAGFSVTKDGLQGSFSSVDFPRALTTSAFGINDYGDVVGRYNSSDNSVHGYLFTNGDFQSIDVQGAILTVARSVTNEGEIVGHYDSAPGRSHGFLWSRCEGFVTIDCPGATKTLVRGINANHVIVGHYDDVDGHTHGFIMTP